MKKILIFTYLQRHLKKLLTLIPALQKQHEVYLILMTQEEKAIAEAQGLRYHMLDEYAEWPRDLDFDLGWGLEPLVKALEKIRPDLFIAIEVNYILRNAVHYCKLNNIKSLIIQHGTPNPFSMHAFVPFEGDCFAAWGAYTRDILKPYFTNADKIIITGGINFDRTATLSPDKEKLTRELNISAGKRWVLFTTQSQGAGGLPTEEEIRQGVLETTRATLRHPECQLIFQVHPSQVVNDIAKIVNEVDGQNAVVLKYHDTEMLIAASDAVITFFSTTAIDAVLLHKPLLLITLAGDGDFYPFVNEGAALGAYTPAEVGRGFENLLFITTELKNGQDKMARYMNHENDGKALDRILLLCEHLMVNQS